MRLKPLVLVVHALLGWAICGGIVAVRREVLSLEKTLVVHAMVAPMVFALLTWNYFWRFPAASPLGTAEACLSVVVGLDLIVVAPFPGRSYAIFTSIIYT